MINKKIWIYGKNSVFSLLQERKRKIFEIQIVDEDTLSKIDINYHKICKIVSKKQLLKNLNVDISHQNIAACVEDIANNNLQVIDDHVVVLDNIYDHRNIGSIIRSCVAFGIKNIIINKKDFSSGSQLMHKTASGAVEKMNFFLVTNISNSLNILKQKNYTCVSFVGNSSQNIYENTKILLHKKIAFIFGSEDSGIRDLTKKNSDYLMSIPIRNIESLNVSNAVTSVLTFHDYLISESRSKKVLS